jgi:hypothetical protein
MTTMTAVEFEKGQAVRVFTDDEWCKGVVVDVDENRSRPYLVKFNENGVGDESWFGPASVQPR